MALWEGLAEAREHWIGGTLTDLDAPDEPTRIEGITFDGKMLTIIGADFSWGLSREWLRATSVLCKPGALQLSGAGLACIIEPPPQA